MIIKQIRPSKNYIAQIAFLCVLILLGVGVPTIVYGRWDLLAVPIAMTLGIWFYTTSQRIELSESHMTFKRIGRTSWSVKLQGMTLRPGLGGQIRAMPALFVYDADGRKAGELWWTDFPRAELKALQETYGLAARQKPAARKPISREA